MHRSKLIRPVNSLLFIADPAGGEEVPEWVRGELILSTSSCISVGCYPEQDGPTEIVLGKASEVDPGGNPAFEGDLETPGGAITISTVDNEKVLEMKVTGARTHVRVWINHPRWPDKVTVGVE